MTHGDDDGLVVPPRLAPTQVVVVPIWRDDEQRTRVLAKARSVEAILSDEGVRVRIDDRAHLNPGAKFYEWERKGVPFRVEVGPRDLEKGQLCVVRRLVPEGERRKSFLPEDEALATLSGKLEAFQDELLECARARREAHSHRGVDDWDEMKEILDAEGGFVYTGWSGDPAVEARVKDEMKATIRVIPGEEFRSERPPERCISGEAPSEMEVAWARAY